MTRSTTERPDVERCDEPTEWDDFVERNGGSPFTLWGWGDVVETYDHDRHYLAVRESSEIVGALPLIHMESRLFGDKLVSMPFSERGSVVTSDGAPNGTKRALLERTADLADRLGVDFVSLRGRDLGAAAMFEPRNRFVTFEVPLDSPDVVWDGLDSSRRGHVRQAREADLAVGEATSLDDVRAYYRLYLEGMRGHGSPPHSFEFYRRLWASFGGDRMKMYLATADGTLVNGIIVFPFGDRVHHGGSVSDYEYRDLDGGSLLLWTALEWGSENGYSTFEFGRTREGSGVYSFKKSFGGEKVWYDDYHYFPDAEVDLPDAEDETYDRAKQIWRRLPIPVTRLVGPSIRKSISL